VDKSKMNGPETGTSHLKKVSVAVRCAGDRLGRKRRLRENGKGQKPREKNSSADLSTTPTY